MDELDKLLQALAQRGSQAQDKDNGLAWRIISLVLFLAGLFWVKYQMAKRDRELAEARTELERQKLDADWQVYRAEVSRLDSTALELATNARDLAAKALDEQTSAEARFAEQKKTLAQVQNWDDLNRIAGVKP